MARQTPEFPGFSKGEERLVCSPFRLDPQFHGYRLISDISNYSVLTTLRLQSCSAYNSASFLTILMTLKADPIQQGRDLISSAYEGPDAARRHPGKASSTGGSRIAF